MAETKVMFLDVIWHYFWSNLYKISGIKFTYQALHVNLMAPKLHEPDEIKNTGKENKCQGYLKR